MHGLLIHSIRLYNRIIVHLIITCAYTREKCPQVADGVHATFDIDALKAEILELQAVSVSQPVFCLPVVSCWARMISDSCNCLTHE